jgi:NitT/TauT family transport system ATP-binding protein
VARNVGLGLRPDLRLDRSGWERVEAALAAVGLEGLGRRRPAELSGGERRRAALARALLRDRPLLLLDEPFAALDAITREAMDKELERILLLQPCTTVLVTHSITEALLLADRVVSLSPRPAEVRAITEVPFPRPRPLELQYEPAFQGLVRTVRSHLETGAGR